MIVIVIRWILNIKPYLLQSMMHLQLPCASLKQYIVPNCMVENMRALKKIFNFYNTDECFRFSLTYIKYYISDSYVYPKIINHFLFNYVECKLTSDMQKFKNFKFQQRCSLRRSLNLF